MVNSFPSAVTSCQWSCESVLSGAIKHQSAAAVRTWTWNYWNPSPLYCQHNKHFWNHFWQMTAGPWAGLAWVAVTIVKIVEMIQDKTVDNRPVLPVNPSPWSRGDQWPLQLQETMLQVSVEFFISDIDILWIHKISILFLKRGGKWNIKMGNDNQTTQW